ncbi:MAG: peptide/nickel transport system substrate-binding protein [Methylobacteriaceae bacterium]|nr:peptide/nickel transport system substrate-binding protein [Methylobacteriaceae bacterium]
MDGLSIRARVTHTAALALCALLVSALPAAAEPVEIPTHGIAMHGEPALPLGFDHLPYANPDAPKGGRLVVGVPGTFDSLNSYNLKAGSAAQGLAGNVFQSLMQRSFDEPFTLYGLIAQSIETDDARSFVTFHLDPRAHFSDGQPVTSADVAFTFDLLKNKGRPQQRAAFSLVRSVTTPDVYTIRYDLSGIGDRELPLTLAIMPVLPKHATDIERFSESTLAPPVGSGPYKVAEVKVGERIVLKRDPNYWGRDLPIQKGLHNFDEIDVDYFRDANSLFESFKAGLIDYRDESNTTRWITGYNFPAVRDGRVVKEALPIGVPKGMEGFAFNLRRPLFQDIRVREALSIMFDFEWLNASLFSGLYTRTKSFFDDSELASTDRPASEAERALLAPFPGAVRDDIMEGTWRPPQTDGSGRDRKQARNAMALLAQAGWHVADGALMKDGEPFSFEIMVTDRGQERLALNYADQLARIGVTTRVRLVDEVQYQRRRQKFDFDMMIGTWAASASPGNEQRMRWGSGSATQESSFNLAGAQSPAIDAMIQGILAAKTREDFITAVRAYDRVLLSGFYIVPLYHSQDQWSAHWTRIARPSNIPHYAAPLFNVTLDTWWRKNP